MASSNESRTSRPKRRTRAKFKKQKNDSLGAMVRKGVVDHQLGLSINIAIFIGLAYTFFPSLRERLRAFFTLSYESSTEKGMYGQGSRDLYLVATFAVLFTAFRAFCMDYFLTPLARVCGVKTKKARVRFAEQSYMVIYYAIYWTWGVVMFWQNTPNNINDIRSLLLSLWTGFPQLYSGFGMKLYYISQSGFWIHQFIVIHVEEMRKDHFQMLTHHVITVMLLAGSHMYRQWRVGNAILVCMDLVDLIFPIAKILRYMELQTACDAMFGLFVISWLVTRHIFYIPICWSIYTHVHEVTMHYGVYSLKDGSRISNHGGDDMLINLFQPILNPGATTITFNSRIRFFFLGLLLALQCITIVWFVMICRVVMRVLKGQGADDTRSDSEREEDEEEEISEEDQYHETEHAELIDTVPAAAEKPRYIEVEVDSESLSYNRRREAGSPSLSSSSSSKRKSKGISSGLNLNGHKEILNRIGCLSEEQLAREREKLGSSMSPHPSSAAGKR